MLEVAANSRCSLLVAVSTSTYTQRNKINSFLFEKVIELVFENNYPNMSNTFCRIKTLTGNETDI